jgi:hypothetical protein
MSFKIALLSLSLLQLSIAFVLYPCVRCAAATVLGNANVDVRTYCSYTIDVAINKLAKLAMTTNADASVNDTLLLPNDAKEVHVDVGRHGGVVKIVNRDSAASLPSTTSTAKGNNGSKSNINMSTTSVVGAVGGWFGSRVDVASKYINNVSISNATSNVNVSHTTVTMNPTAAVATVATITPPPAAAAASAAIVINPPTISMTPPVLAQPQVVQSSLPPPLPSIGPPGTNAPSFVVSGGVVGIRAVSQPLLWLMHNGHTGSPVRVGGIAPDNYSFTQYRLLPSPFDNTVVAITCVTPMGHCLRASSQSGGIIDVVPLSSDMSLLWHNKECLFRLINNTNASITLGSVVQSGWLIGHTPPSGMCHMMSPSSATDITTCERMKLDPLFTIEHLAPSHPQPSLVGLPPTVMQSSYVPTVPQPASLLPGQL